MLKSSSRLNLVSISNRDLKSIISSAFPIMVINVTNCKTTYHNSWKIAQLFQNYLIT